MQSYYELTYIVVYEDRGLLEKFAQNLGFNFWKTFNGVIGYKTVWPEKEFETCFISAKNLHSLPFTLKSVVMFDSMESLELALEDPKIGEAQKVMKDYKMRVLPEIFIGKLEYQWNSGE